MKKKTAFKVFACLAFFTMTITGCKINAPKIVNPDYSNDPRYQIYQLAVSDGYSGTYEQWLASIKGQDGKDGHSPVITIGDNGNWFIDNVDTGVKAKGEDGKDGTNGKDGVDGKDGTNGTNGVDGKNGADGSTLINGQGVPSNNLGKVGDTYIDLDTWDYYVKENAGWVKKGNIKGQDGNDVTFEDEQGLSFYILDDGNYGVGLGNAGFLNEITVPAKFRGKDVTTIVTAGFSSQHSGDITSTTKILNLPSTIRKINKYAFTYSSINTINYEGTVDDFLKIEREEYWYHTYVIGKENGLKEINASNGKLLIDNGELKTQVNQIALSKEEPTTLFISGGYLDKLEIYLTSYTGKYAETYDKSIEYEIENLKDGFNLTININKDMSDSGFAANLYLYSNNNMASYSLSIPISYKIEPIKVSVKDAVLEGSKLTNLTTTFDRYEITGYVVAKVYNNYWIADSLDANTSFPHTLLEFYNASEEEEAKLLKGAKVKLVTQLYNYNRQIENSNPCSIEVLEAGTAWNQVVNEVTIDEANAVLQSLKPHEVTKDLYAFTGKISNVSIRDTNNGYITFTLYDTNTGSQIYCYRVSADKDVVKNLAVNSIVKVTAYLTYYESYSGSRTYETFLSGSLEIIQEYCEHRYTDCEIVLIDENTCTYNQNTVCDHCHEILDTSEVIYHSWSYEYTPIENKPCHFNVVATCQMCGAVDDLGEMENHGHLVTSIINPEDYNFTPTYSSSIFVKEECSDCGLLNYVEIDTSVDKASLAKHATSSHAGLTKHYYENEQYITEVLSTDYVIDHIINEQGVCEICGCNHFHDDTIGFVINYLVDTTTYNDLSFIYNNLFSLKNFTYYTYVYHYNNSGLIAEVLYRFFDVNQQMICTVTFEYGYSKTYGANKAIRIIVKYLDNVILDVSAVKEEDPSKLGEKVSMETSYYTAVKESMTSEDTLEFYYNSADNMLYSYTNDRYAEYELIEVSENIYLVTYQDVLGVKYGHYIRYDEQTKSFYDAEIESNFIAEYSQTVNGNTTTYILYEDYLLINYETWYNGKPYHYSIIANYTIHDGYIMAYPLGSSVDLYYVNGILFK